MPLILSLLERENSQDNDSYLMIKLSTDFGLTLLFDPLPRDQGLTEVTVLSPCCNDTLRDVYPHYTSKVDSHCYGCNECRELYKFPESHFDLTNGNFSWEPEKETLYSLVEYFLDPLAATLATDQIAEILSHIMNRASAEYAWKPEGNIRGPAPLSISMKREICGRIISKYELEEKVI